MEKNNKNIVLDEPTKLPIRINVTNKLIKMVGQGVFVDLNNSSNKSSADNSTFMDDDNEIACLKSDRNNRFFNDNANSSQAVDKLVNENQHHQKQVVCDNNISIITSVAAIKQPSVANDEVVTQGVPNCNVFQNIVIVETPSQSSEVKESISAVDPSKQNCVEPLESKLTANNRSKVAKSSSQKCKTIDKLMNEENNNGGNKKSPNKVENIAKITATKTSETCSSIGVVLATPIGITDSLKNSFPDSTIQTASEKIVRCKPVVETTTEELVLVRNETPSPSTLEADNDDKIASINLGVDNVPHVAVAKITAAATKQGRTTLHS